MEVKKEKKETLREPLYIHSSIPFNSFHSLSGKINWL